MSELLCCPICKTQPAVYHANVRGGGKIWWAECLYDSLNRQPSLLKTPFVEHELCVYGRTKKEAEGHWNKVMARMTSATDKP